jgi:hypothetical protein
MKLKLIPLIFVGMLFTQAMLSNPCSLGDSCKGKSCVCKIGAALLVQQIRDGVSEPTGHPQDIMKPNVAPTREVVVILDSPCGNYLGDYHAAPHAPRPLTPGFSLFP